MYQMRARWYRQATGRFASRDPLEGVLCCGLSWNPYIYVTDNPVNAVDPTGRAAGEEDQIEELEISFENLEEYQEQSANDFYRIDTTKGLDKVKNILREFMEEYNSGGSEE
jgi:hypothetical protein